MEALIAEITDLLETLEGYASSNWWNCNGSQDEHDEYKNIQARAEAAITRLNKIKEL